jgi:hypothetical protein
MSAALAVLTSHEPRAILTVRRASNGMIKIHALREDDGIRSELTIPVAPADFAAFLKELNKNV